MKSKIARIDEITAASEQTADALKNIKRRLADMAVLIKNITTNQKTKPVYEMYKKAMNKEQFRIAHESDLILYEAAQRHYAPLMLTASSKRRRTPGRVCKAVRSERSSIR
jgi:hypothetical protein